MLGMWQLRISQWTGLGTLVYMVVANPVNWFSWTWAHDMAHNIYLLNKLKVKFSIYIADHKATTYIYEKVFLLRCVNSAALQLVRCHSIRLPRRVASWVNYSRQRTESVSEHYASDLSLLKADALCENKRYSDSNPWPMVWIRKRVCYPLHHSTPQARLLTCL